MGYVKDFIDNAVISYALEPDMEEEKKCLFYYQRARKEIKEWLRKVLLSELSKGEYTDVRVTLYLPLKDMKVHLKCCEDDEGYPPGRSPELFHTPIGVMDYETCQAITGGKDNPVAMLYEHLYWHAANIRMQCVKENQVLLRADVLEYGGVRDVLGLHRMEYVFCGILEFLSGKQWLDRS